MFWFILILTIIYVGATVFFSIGWLSLPKNKLPEDFVEKKLITVIIPVRNEAKNILFLLDDLSRQRYDAFEVLVMDDASDDDTAFLVETFAKTSPYKVRLVKVNAAHVTVSHKKAAIEQGVALAQGQYILTTDGDCRVGVGWLAAFAHAFAEQQAVMLSGPVTFFDGKTFFEKMQTAEFASLVGAGAASLYWGAPNMCNGANLAYSKAAFEAVGGYNDTAQVASGDDEFLMHKIAKTFAGGVRFLKSPEAVVTTQAHTGWQSFYHQRKRWASKWRYYRNWQAAATAIFIFGFHLLQLYLCAATLAGVFSWQQFAFIAVLRLAGELCFLVPVLLFLQRREAILYIFPVAMVYSVYAVFFAIAGLTGSYVWKGRNVK